MGTNRKSHLNIRKNFTMGRVAEQRACGASVLGDVWDPTGHGPEQPAVGHPTLERPQPHPSLSLGSSVLRTAGLCGFCGGVMFSNSQPSFPWMWTKIDAWLVIRLLIQITDQSWPKGQTANIFHQADSLKLHPSHMRCACLSAYRNGVWCIDGGKNWWNLTKTRADKWPDTLSIYTVVLKRWDFIFCFWCFQSGKSQQ